MRLDDHLRGIHLVVTESTAGLDESQLTDLMRRLMASGLEIKRVDFDESNVHVTLLLPRPEEGSEQQAHLSAWVDPLLGKVWAAVDAVREDS